MIDNYRALGASALRQAWERLIMDRCGACGRSEFLTCNLFSKEGSLNLMKLH